ncbi:MAG TPA: bifunctional UDP-3-O-[3-hydroxymyristoyl] N-acetylglucosamine deacetylase/3-hydroxyacyl-ACP dehydratase [Bacteroidia bacterium]|jgi:UDP-3-O-[3-hydroxymyristoyl] N-acetylglucosamine deacetylase/3-hydroxyacyl-[acyl-carrier-protein] dehydratase|nr:bifunctional UDP-3-O-[3-hydroxymyristoyl] N-acetylglucosamine deacetylase/3-hydroxyacyl-ACP dehydratase [Bacteroidia bacterium]
MSEKQRTIKKAVSLTGVGLHTGKKVTLTFNPAPENHWYKFQRVDLEGNPVIEADADLVVDTSRGTVLEKNGARVHTIEHVLAALRGLEIDNCLIQVDAPEMPIMDGSSIKFVEALEAAEIAEQEALREYFELKENLSYEDPVKRVEMLAVPQETFRVTVMVDYNSDVLGTQHAGMYHLGEFKNEIAKCRTFVFLHELEALLAHNLIKGGDLDNAIVLVDKEVPKEKLDYLRKVFNKQDVEIKGRGVLNNTKLHYYNEPARHKLLDIVGDLALVGRPLKIHVLAARPGHAGNVEFAKKIKELIKKEKRDGSAPRVDLTAKPLYNTQDIMKILPHRQPMLLVDKIMELGPDYVIGVKNVTLNEEFFKGHFPDEPVMPGVLLIESMAQCGGVLVLKTVPDPENYQTYFIKIENVKFKQKVVPGDTLVFSLNLLSPIRRGICHMKGVAFVNNKAVMEAEMMAQIVKVRNIDKKVTETQPV